MKPLLVKTTPSLILPVAGLVLLLGLSACNTFRGFGEDMRKTGIAVSDGADEVSKTL